MASKGLGSKDKEHTPSPEKRSGNKRTDMSTSQEAITHKFGGQQQNDRRDNYYMDSDEDESKIIDQNSQRNNEEVNEEVDSAYVLDKLGIGTLESKEAESMEFHDQVSPLEKQNTHQSSN